LFEEYVASPAYQDLSTAARCLFHEFLRIYRPSRNGSLSISTRKATALINVSEPTASRAFHELAEHGFLKLNQEAQWQQRMTREWTLTTEPCNGREPTDDWRRWSPGNPLPTNFKKLKKTPTKESNAELHKKPRQLAKENEAELSFYETSNVMAR